MVLMMSHCCANENTQDISASLTTISAKLKSLFSPNTLDLVSPALRLSISLGRGVQSSQLGPVVWGGCGRRRDRTGDLSESGLTEQQLMNTDWWRVDNMVTDFCSLSASSRVFSECWAGYVHCGISPPENRHRGYLDLSDKLDTVLKCSPLSLWKNSPGSVWWADGALWAALQSWYQLTWSCLQDLGIQREYIRAASTQTEPHNKICLFF